mgnify:CR=1 FL=1
MTLVFISAFATIIDISLIHAYRYVRVNEIVICVILGKAQGESVAELSWDGSPNKHAHKSMRLAMSHPRLRVPGNAEHLIAMRLPREVGDRSTP